MNMNDRKLKPSEVIFKIFCFLRQKGGSNKNGDKLEAIIKYLDFCKGFPTYTPIDGERISIDDVEKIIDELKPNEPK